MVRRKELRVGGSHPDEIVADLMNAGTRLSDPRVSATIPGVKLEKSRRQLKLVILSASEAPLTRTETQGEFLARVIRNGAALCPPETALQMGLDPDWWSLEDEFGIQGDLRIAMEPIPVPEDEPRRFAFGKRGIIPRPTILAPQARDEEKNDPNRLWVFVSP